ncbi:MAG: hypothetical protein KA203_04830 [Aquabacterium sp.]|nr:hypothetical protein [Aquabacterium sp.]
MIYLKNGHSITIGNAGALASRTHVSYADVSGATLDGSSAIVTSSATTYNVATYAAAGTRNVRLVTVSNDGASAGVFTISHNTGATTAPIGKALLQPGQVLVYSENGGVQVSSAESSTLATLTLPDTPNPTVPSDSYGTIFIKKIAGRVMAAQIGPSGLDTTLQANLGGNKVAMWMPPGGSTTAPGVFGMAALTAVGTATARTVATTNLLSRMTRLGYVSAATAGALAGAREAVAKFTTGAGPGLGGFFARYRFGISDPATVAGARMFVGLDALTAAPTNIDPSTKVNCIGVGQIGTSGNLHIIRGNATAKTPIDLGVSFPANTNADAYELSLFAPPAGGCYWQVRRLNTTFEATGFLPSTEIPVATQLLCHQLWRCNNATALAVGLDVCGIYIETDH